VCKSETLFQARPCPVRFTPDATRQAWKIDETAAEGEAGARRPGLRRQTAIGGGRNKSAKGDEKSFDSSPVQVRPAKAFGAAAKYGLGKGPAYLPDRLLEPLNARAFFRVLCLAFLGSPSFSDQKQAVRGPSLESF
jgi:hypothetical protein